MRHARLIVSFVVGVSACSALIDDGGLVDGVRVDASVVADGAPDTDAADVGDVGALDADAGSWCEQQRPKPLFCADFDTASAFDFDWDGPPTIVRGAMRFELGDTVSPPRSWFSEAYPNEAGVGGNANMSRRFAGVFHEHRL